MSAEGHEVTRLLQAWSEGDASARDRLMSLVYGELRRRAAAHLRRERRNDTLQPTALVHEAYLRLVGQRRAAWQNRAQFFAVAAHVMRRLLVDHARARDATKRGARLTLSLDGVDAAGDGRSVDFLALDEALDKLAAACSAACSPIDDKRGTIEFRTRVAGVLAKRAAKIAYQRAGGK